MNNHVLGTIEIETDPEYWKEWENKVLSLSEEEFNYISDRLEAWHGAILAQSYTNGILHGSLLLTDLEFQLWIKDRARRLREGKKDGR